MTCGPPILRRSNASSGTLVAWQHTAEVHSDPELPTALTSHREDDYGPVPDPRDVV
ncbi:hypothetical protein ACQ4WX_19370 [Streptomyces lasalocidi]